MIGFGGWRGSMRKFSSQQLVAGTRGYGLLVGLLLGGVTHRLLHIAHCPDTPLPCTTKRRHGLTSGGTTKTFFWRLPLLIATKERFPNAEVTGDGHQNCNT